MKANLPRSHQRQLTTTMSSRCMMGSFSTISLIGFLCLQSVCDSNADPPLLSAPARVWPYFQFVLVGESNATYVIQSSTDLATWTAVSTNRSIDATRLMQVTPRDAQSFFQVFRLREPLFTHALAAVSLVDLNGNNLTTDSFDSSDPDFSTGGGYDVLKRKDNGNVAVNSDLPDALGIGNATIMGHVSTAQGGSVAVGPNGSVGSVAWILSGNLGIEPGWFTDDVELHPLDVQVPFTTAAPPVEGNVDGVSYAYLLSSGEYMLPALELTSTNRMRVIGDAFLYVSGALSIYDSGVIEISPAASLKLFVGGTVAVINGHGILNNAGNATNFQYYGLADNISIDLRGGSFTGLIYAPNADLYCASVASYDFVGASVTKTARISGPIKLHYDENLRRNGPNR